MDIVNTVLNGFDDEAVAALFCRNFASSREDIEAACRDAKVYGEVANRLVDKVGLVPGEYIAHQPVYGPLVRMMSLAGWTVSGSGYFSVAFWKGGLALKISLRGTSDASLDYLKWVRDNDGLPGLPRLYALGEYDFCYSVVMERYEPITREFDEESSRFDPHLKAEFDSLRGILQNGETLQGFATCDTATAIREAFKGNARWDLHHGNVMLDRDGNLIITDPMGRSRERSTDYGGYTYTYSTGGNYSQAA